MENKMGDHSNNNIKANGMAQEVEKKMKEYVKHFFKQLKFGCHRRLCYNPYCAKSTKGKSKNIENIISLGYQKLTDKEIIVEAFKFAKGVKCEQLLCIDLRKAKSHKEVIIDGGNEWIDLLETSVEDFLLSFEQNKDVDYTSYIEGRTLPPLNLNIEKLMKYYSSSHREIENDIRCFNEYFSVFFDKSSTSYIDINFKDPQYKSLLYYLFYLFVKSLIYIVLHPNFSLTENSTRDYTSFFKTYLTIKRHIKDAISAGVNFNLTQHELSSIYLSAFVELSNPDNKAIFQSLIGNCQNFLTVILFNLASNDLEEDEEIIDERIYMLLVNFMKTFTTFYKVNMELKIVHYREFYNDGLSKNLNLKRECQTYLDIMNHDFEGKKPFCLINYHWILDAAAKSDILYIFNYHKQRREMLNIFSDHSHMLNMLSAGSMYLYLQVRRNNLIEDTLNYLSNSGINFQKPLKVKFIGEQGVDEGGVKKEFFLLVVRQLFDPNYSMFSYLDKSRVFWFNPYSFEPKIKFELIGCILGLAFFNNVILDIKFPLVIYKKLLNLPTSLEDMREIDFDLYNNFKYLLNMNEGNIKDVLYSTFTVTIDKFGEKEVIPLKENGDNIYIDETNREEYVSLYLDWYFNKSIENVFSYFRNGFYRVCDIKLFHMLRPEELELIICGTQLLDFKELEKSARYEDGYEKDSTTVKYFWEVIHSITDEEKKKFLFFLTGCDRAPINGLGSLVITISRYGPDSEKLPCAHTCFNHFLLPDYQNKEKLRQRLIIAINNSEGFGMI